MSISQTAITLATPGTFERVTDRVGDQDSLAQDEALVRVHRIGVCGTDIHAFHGRQPFFEYPRILGHELGVEIIAGDGLGHLKVGDACAVEPYLNRSDSPASLRGKSNCCEELQVLGVHCDGGMRPLIKVPTAKLHAAQGLSLDQLALVEMLCIGHHAVSRATVTSGEFTAVVGAGPIGLSVLSFLKNRTDRIVVVDLDAGRLRFCRDHFGVEETIKIEDGLDLETALRNASGDGTLPTSILDATGHAGSMHSTFDLIAHGGSIVFVGLFQGEMAFNDPNFHRREITLKASRNATADDFQSVIAEIAAGRVDTAPWITHRLALDDVPEKFAGVIGDPTLQKAIIDVQH